MNHFTYTEISDIRYCIKARIMQIEDTMLPLCQKLDDSELSEMYRKELDSLNSLLTKIYVEI
jgi:hypothetical protein